MFDWIPNASLAKSFEKNWLIFFSYKTKSSFLQEMETQGDIMQKYPWKNYESLKKWKQKDSAENAVGHSV